MTIGYSRSANSRYRPHRFVTSGPPDRTRVVRGYTDDDARLMQRALARPLAQTPHAWILLDGEPVRGAVCSFENCASGATIGLLVDAALPPGEPPGALMLLPFCQRHAWAFLVSDHRNPVPIAPYVGGWPDAWKDYP